MSFMVGVLPMLFLMGVYAGMIVLAILSYVLRGLGLYSMAKNTAEENPWLAWIPFAHEYLVGKMADRYTASRGKSTQYARLLLILMVTCAGLSVVLFLSMFLTTFAAVFSTVGGENAINSLLVIPSVLFILLYLCFFAAIIAFKVFQVMAHHQIYLDFTPQSATLYTILTVFSLDFICKFIIRSNVPTRVAGTCSGAQPQYRAHPNR